RRFRLTDIAYFAPAEATLREGLIGTSFQSGDYPVLDENYTVEYLEELDGDFPECNESNGSNESNFSNCTQPMPSWRKEPLLPITWTSFWTLGRPSLGWNAKRIDPPILSRRVRLRGMPAAGACQIREVELRGQIFSESCAMEVSSSFPVPAVGVSRGAPLQQLAVQIKGVTQVEEQLLMMPGGSLGVWMRVDTNEPTELLVEATVPENFEPKTVPLQIFAKRYERGEFLSTDIMETRLAQFEVFSDTPRLTRTSTTLVAPMGLWFLEFVSASPMQLGDLVALTPGVDFLVQSLRIPNVVHPSAKKTPFVASIDPPEGPFMGGSNIVLQGQGFLCNGTTSPEELAVNLSATPCVIYTATDTEIRCRSAPQTELGGGEVTLKSGCGEALVAPGVSFIYVTRWSIPSDWPYAEPPIPTDETVIPSGSHVILDYPTPKLSLLRVEGHLEMDLMVFSHRVEAQGLRRYGLMVTDRYPGECAWAEAQGSLLVRSPFRRSTVLTSPAVAGSKALQIRSPIDVRPGERILIMGGSAAAPEEHVVMAVEPDGQSGQVLMLEDSIIHDREGGIHQLDAIQEQILYNFGEVDLSATVASLSGRAHFYGAQGGAFIDCIGSSGSCGLEGLVFSSCGQVAPGTSGVPCVNLKAVRPSAFVTDSVFLDAAGPAAVLQ
ncbi:Fibrocystin-L (Polycystic kidney and hepatic disease 1-like protein 1) (PKHD1-like protein 1), partial [Durusdinium trenchii]